MNYSEAINYIEQIKNYGSKPGLEVVKELLERLKNPQDKLNIIHIAGTNGKGSTIAFVESILLENGYSVGKYCSPAVFEYREIIKLNNENIDANNIAELLSEIKNVCDSMVEDGFRHPTVFEVETAMALKYFEKTNPDIVLLECGMGGVEDATNITKKALCNIFTSISMDHMNFLGDTIEKIARNKAGIIKENSVVVAADQAQEIIEVLKDKAEECNSEFRMAKKSFNLEISGFKTCFDYQSNKNNNYHIELNCLGTYQIKNATLAVEVAEALMDKGYKIQNIEKALKKVIWPGRLEIINKNPLVVLDGAHNKEAIEELEKSINTYFTNRKITFIMGVLADKDIIRYTSNLLGKAKKIICVTPDNPRALDGEKLADELNKINVCADIMVAKSFENAVQEAVDFACNNESDMVLAFGSLSYLRHIKRLIGSKDDNRN